MSPEFHRAALVLSVESGQTNTATPTDLRVSQTGSYDDIMSGARRCTSQETCAVAGGVRGCRCPVAVRANAKGAVDAAARAASCEQVERLYCPPLVNPRCVNGTCVADPAPE
jgi:hypothetical protein